MSADAAAIQAGNGGETGRKLRLLTLDDLDARTRARRRADDLRERVIAERGGADRVDTLRLVHAGTWAVLSAMIEDQLARLLLGEPIEPTAVATLVNARRREGEVIGAPEPCDVTPSLAQYLASKAATVAVDSVSAPAEPSTATGADERTSAAPTGSTVP